LITPPPRNIICAFPVKRITRCSGGVDGEKKILPLNLSVIWALLILSAVSVHAAPRQSIPVDAIPAFTPDGREAYGSDAAACPPRGTPTPHLPSTAAIPASSSPSATRARRSRRVPLARRRQFGQRVEVLRGVADAGFQRDPRPAWAGDVRLQVRRGRSPVCPNRPTRLTCPTRTGRTGWTGRTGEIGHGIYCGAWPYTTPVITISKIETARFIPTSNINKFPYFPFFLFFLSGLA